jgi:ABC-2 type transport system ATP-binding protein
MARGRVLSEGSVDDLRARVALKRVRCVTHLRAADVASWSEVVEARDEGGRLWLSTGSAEALVRRLLAADATLDQLEVHRAGLAEAFTELTRAAEAPTETREAA